MPLDRAKEYAHEKYLLYFADILFTIIFLLTYQFLLSEAFKNFSLSFYSNIIIGNALYLIILSLIYYLSNFPLNYYSGFILEHKFSLSNQSFLDWFKDDFKKGLLSLVIFIILIEAFYLLLRKTELWWLLAGLAWMLFNIFFAKVLPTLIIPLFYKYKELENVNTRERIKALALKANIRLIDIFQIDYSKKTKKANAALVGIGKSRRVILTDTLIKDFYEDEIEIVCAHEFAHHKLLHIWKMLIIFGGSNIIGLYFLSLVFYRVALALRADSLYDIKILPMISLILFLIGFFLRPIHNAYSRRLENQADRFAITLSGNPDAFITVMKKLSKINLSDENPPKIIKYLLYDHPPISERIKTAQTYAKR